MQIVTRCKNIYHILYYKVHKENYFFTHNNGGMRIHSQVFCPQPRKATLSQWGKMTA